LKIQIQHPLAITGLYYAASSGWYGCLCPGPTLPSLAEQTGVQLKQASLLFTTVNLGYLLGALASGRLYDRRFGHIVMVLGLCWQRC